MTNRGTDIGRERRSGNALVLPVDVHVHDVVGEIDTLHVIDVVERWTDEESRAEDGHGEVRLLRFDVLPDSLFRLLLGNAV